MKNGDEKLKFGQALKTILHRNGLKIGEMANALGVTQGYASQVINGTQLFTEDRFLEITEYLQKNGVPEDDTMRLQALYMNAKNGTAFLASPGIDQISTIHRHFLDLFIQLTGDQQIKLLKIMLQDIEDNRTKQSQNAGLEP